MAGASTVRQLQPGSWNNATSVPYGSPLTAGSLLVLVIFDSGENNPVVTDTLGNTWRQVAKSAVSSYVAIYYAANTKPGACTVSSTSATELWAWEVTAGLVTRSSMPGVVVLDEHRTSSGTGTTANPGTMTPSHPSVFLVSATRDSGGQTVTGGAAGWSFDHNSVQTGIQTFAPTSIAAQTGSFTIGSSDNWDAACASFAFPNPDAAAIVQPKMKPFLV